MSQAPLSLSRHNPDVLTCIANLSNDEVFTPPEFANQMLDTLTTAWADSHDGENIWANQTVKFLDPVTKSGVFLREITSRLVNGLANSIPGLEERVDHILTQQVYGLGITQLTSLLARRSVYCSKWANGEHSIAKSLGTADGNIWFERTEHAWRNGRCAFCGANEGAYARSANLETHAYAFIHSNDILARLAQLFGDNVKFDVIIGNPPYQLDDGGFGTSAAPIYQHFVERAFDLQPQHAVFVTPSRWFAGGKGLDGYRERLLSDRRMQHLVDYPKLYDGFPGVKIRGGISYFLWSRDHDGPCTVQTMWDGRPIGEPVARFLDSYDVLVRRNEAVPILDKVRTLGEPTLADRVSSRKPFGLATNYRGKSTNAGMSQPVKLFANQRTDWIERDEIPINADWVDNWKVLMTAVQGTSAAVETKFLSRPIIAEPGMACTETYLIAGRFDTEEQALRYSSYLRTRFVRFMVSLRKSTQHATRDVYSFVPDLPLDRTWTDSLLYARYGLTAEEIQFLESQVAEHDDRPDEVADEAVDD
jgi:hypothetical protein